MDTESSSENKPFDDRAVLRRFVLIFFGLLALVLIGIGGALFLRQGPAEYVVSETTAEQRELLLARAESELREAMNALSTGDSVEARLQRDVATVAIAIQRHALANEGRLPRTLAEAGITPDEVEPGLRYSYGSRYWRLFQENNRLLARGN